MQTGDTLARGRPFLEAQAMPGSVVPGPMSDRGRCIPQGALHHLSYNPYLVVQDPWGLNICTACRLPPP